MARHRNIKLKYNYDPSGHTHSSDVHRCDIEAFMGVVLYIESIFTLLSKLQPYFMVDKTSDLRASEHEDYELVYIKYLFSRFRSNSGPFQYPVCPDCQLNCTCNSI